MDDNYLLDRGYKEYPITPFDDEYIVARFQKRFDDEVGKKYFINVVKWSHDFVPECRRDSLWTPYSYEYEVQVAMNEDDPINLNFFSCWTLENVEKFMEEFFVKMLPKYYETWDEC
jgi:hypothetical protein